METNNPKIRVLVRKRPLNKKEIAKGENDIVSVDSLQTVIVKEQKYNHLYPDWK